MPDTIPASFRGGAGQQPSSAAGPSLTTSVYETHLGLAALTWSRTVLGLSLRVVLRLCDEEEEEEEEEEEKEEELLRFRIRPWLLWKRRGTRRFHLKDHPRRHRCVDFAWDLAGARFPAGGGPEPVSGFFVAVTVDGEMLLVAGDLADQAYRKTKAQRPQNPLLPCHALVSRQEHVVLVDHGDRRSYRTQARFGGQDHDISIELAAKEKGREASMAVGFDGERVLQVRRLRWKFRGSAKVDLRGRLVQVSWDLHSWFFQPKDGALTSATGGATVTGAAAEMGQAVFVIRFEGEGGEEEEEEEEGNSGKDAGKTEREGRVGNAICRTSESGVHDGKTTRNAISNRSERSGGRVGERRRGRQRSLKKTDSSSSSTSSASTASTSTVMGWSSAEEEELRRPHGFSLLVYARKN